MSTTDNERPGEDITFEEGYERLKQIVHRLGEDATPLDELLEGFREGSGLIKALSDYLKEREGELAEIESGQNLPTFNVVASSSARGPEPVA